MKFKEGLIWPNDLSPKRQNWCRNQLAMWGMLKTMIYHKQISVDDLRDLLTYEVFYSNNPRGYVISRLFSRYWNLESKRQRKIINDYLKES